MIRRIVLLTAALLLTGCGTLPGLVDALARDKASACVRVSNMLYGTLVACRTNAVAGVIQVSPEGSVEIQHRGE